MSYQPNSQTLLKFSFSFLLYWLQATKILTMTYAVILFLAWNCALKLATAKRTGKRGTRHTQSDTTEISIFSFDCIMSNGPLSVQYSSELPQSEQFVDCAITHNSNTHFCKQNRSTTFCQVCHTQKIKQHEIETETNYAMYESNEKRYGLSTNGKFNGLLQTNDKSNFYKLHPQYA